MHRRLNKCIVQRAIQQTPMPQPSLGKQFENRLIENRYRLIRLLGEGEFGAVFHGQLEIFGEPVRDVAIKITKHTGLSKETAKSVFGEAIVLARIYDNISDHQARACIVPVFDMGILEQHDRRGFIVMALITGNDSRNRTTVTRPVTLQDEIKRYHKGMGPEPALKIFRQIALGMAAVHEQKVVHRDLKPDNILLTDTGQIRIVDFGLAAGLNDLGHAGGHVGTFRYMAPETSIRGQSTPQSDVYSLGIILYELLTGSHPFDKVVAPTGLTQQQRNEWVVRHKRTLILTPPSTLNPLIQPWLDSVVTTCLKFHPHDRPGNAGVLLQWIQAGANSRLGQINTALTEVDRLIGKGWREWAGVEQTDWKEAADQLKRITDRLTIATDDEQFSALTKLAHCYIHLHQAAEFNSVVARIEKSIQSGRIVQSHRAIIDFYQALIDAVEDCPGMSHYAIGYRSEIERVKTKMRESTGR